MSLVAHVEGGWPLLRQWVANSRVGDQDRHFHGGENIKIRESQGVCSKKTLNETERG